MLIIRLMSQPDKMEYSLQFGKIYFSTYVKRAESSIPIKRATKIVVKL